MGLFGAWGFLEGLFFLLGFLVLLFGAAFWWDFLVGLLLGLCGGASWWGFLVGLLGGGAFWWGCLVMLLRWGFLVGLFGGAFEGAIWCGHCFVVVVV